MKFTRSNFAKAGILICFSFSTLFTNAQSVPNTFFEEDAINTLLGYTDATGVRFYNSVKSQTNNQLTTMAVAIRADGSEINSGRKYRVNQGVDDGGGILDKVNRTTAVALCVIVETLVDTSFSADFTSTFLQEAMAVKNANGIQVAQTTSGSDATFEVTSANLQNGVWSIPGGARSLTATDPCPSFCDEDSSHYVNR